MKFKLRDYQEKAVKAGVDFFEDKSEKRPMLIVAPTGSGKSLIIANIAKSLNGNVLVFQPSKELLEQNVAKYTSYGEPCAIYSASMNRKNIGKVTFATIGSVYKKPELFKDVHYIIADEAHCISPDSHTMYQKFLKAVKGKLLGLTATPVRLKSYSFPNPHTKVCMMDRTRPRTFYNYIHVTQIGELRERNYFSDIEYHQVPFDKSYLKINSTGGDYTGESVTIALKENKTTMKMAESVDLLVNNGRKHILAFLPTVQEAIEVSKYSKSETAFVTGETPKKQREQILNDFKLGKILCVANCGVLTIGFDFPALDTILIGRPTMSLGLYYQIIGRGVRPSPGKDKCVVYDFTGNYERFGKVEEMVVKQEEGLWGIFAGDGRLLTNRDIAKIHTYQGASMTVETKLKFGKHSGTKFEDVPKDYMKWVWENVERKPWTRSVIDWIEKTYGFDKSLRKNLKSKQMKDPDKPVKHLPPQQTYLERDYSLIVGSDNELPF